MSLFRAAFVGRTSVRSRCFPRRPPQSLFIPRDFSCGPFVARTMASQSSLRAPTPRHVLFCNDDGPPDPSDSPFIVPFVAALSAHFGCHASVALPASNMSFIGKAMLAREHAHVHFFDPATQATTRRRTANTQWLLVTGTPATCVNIALGHPDILRLPSSDPSDTLPPIDLVVSGPNVGRNTGAAIILTSGTVGAALEAAMSGVRAIAVSFAYYSGKVFPREDVSRAIAASCDIVQSLWRSWEKGVDVYNVNVPLTPSTDTLPVHRTFCARSYYGCVYAPSFQSASSASAAPKPASPPFGGDNSSASPGVEPGFEPEDSQEERMTFVHGMRMHSSNPAATAFGSDAWAVSTGAMVSVSAISARLGEPDVPAESCVGRGGGTECVAFPYTAVPESLRDLPAYAKRQIK